MAEKIGEAYVEVRADTDGMESGLRGSLGRIGGMVAGAFAAEKIAGFTSSVIGAASDMGETISKVGVIFGDSSGDIKEWASTASSRIGQSSQQAMDAASTFATFGKSAGLAGGDLSGFAMTLGDLSSDLASFHNTSPEEAVEALGAALRGEAEPMRKYGVLLDDATLRNRAMAMGLIATTTDALTPQQKVLAAQAEIMAQTSDAQGDFARTSDGLANKQRTLSAQFADMKVKLGEYLLPVAKTVVTFLSNNMLPAFETIRGAVASFVGAFKNAEDGLTSGGFNGVMERVGIAVRFVADTFMAAWPSIQRAVSVAVEVVAAYIDYLATYVFPPVMEAVRSVVGYVVENWPQIQAAIASVIDWVAVNVVPVVQTVMAALTEEIGRLVEFVRAYWPQVQETIAGVVETVATVLGWLADFWRAWGDDIAAVVIKIFGYIREVIEAGIRIVAEVINLVMSLIRGDWSAAWDALKGMLSAAWDAIVAIVKAAGALLGLALDMVWSLVKKGASAAWDALKGIVSDAVGALVDYVSGLVEDLAGFAGEFLTAAKDVGKAIVSGIGDGLLGLGEALLKPFKAAWNGVASLWNANVGSLSFSVPDWVPGIGGNGFDMPNLPKFHTGGVVPGRPGEEVFAVLQAGERVLTADQAAGSMVGVHIENATFETGVDMDVVARYASMILADMGVAA